MGRGARELAAAAAAAAAAGDDVSPWAQRGDGPDPADPDSLLGTRAFDGPRRLRTAARAEPGTGSSASRRSSSGAGLAQLAGPGHTTHAELDQRWARQASAPLPAAAEREGLAKLTRAHSSSRLTRGEGSTRPVLADGAHATRSHSAKAAQTGGEAAARLADSAQRSGAGPAWANTRSAAGSAGSVLESDSASDGEAGAAHLHTSADICVLEGSRVCRPYASCACSAARHVRRVACCRRAAEAKSLIPSLPESARRLSCVYVCVLATQRLRLVG